MLKIHRFELLFEERHSSAMRKRKNEHVEEAASERHSTILRLNVDDMLGCNWEPYQIPFTFHPTPSQAPFNSIYNH